MVQNADIPGRKGNLPPEYLERGARTITKNFTIPSARFNLNPIVMVSRSSWSLVQQFEDYLLLLRTSRETIKCLNQTTDAADFIYFKRRMIMMSLGICTIFFLQCRSHWLSVHILGAVTFLWAEDTRLERPSGRAAKPDQSQ